MSEQKPATGAYRSTDELTLRDHLALDRTALANERTFLAYVRSAIMLFISGVTLAKLFSDDALILWLGIALVPISFAAVGFGAFRFQRARRHLAGNRGRW